MTNKYGLSRNIPNPIKQKIRQICGFGCVICGCAIYEYHHYNPSFNDAKNHDPSKIALLCGKCHNYITKGHWSEEKLREAHKTPKTLQNGFSSGFFDVSKKTPIISFGNSIFTNVSIIIQAFEIPILKISPPENDGSPFRLSGIFYDSMGQECFRIIENEWQGLVGNWDIEIIGPVVTIRRDQRKIALKLRIDPPDKFYIEKINMLYRGVSIQGNNIDGFNIQRPNGQIISLKSVNMNNLYCAIYISDNDIKIGIKKKPKIKIGRNSLCPCNSGKKYKKCCLNLIKY